MRESEKEKRAKDEVNGQGEKGVPRPHSNASELPGVAINIDGVGH